MLYLGKMSSIYPELVRRVITYGLGSERVSSFSTMVRPSADRTLMTSFEGSMSIETFEFRFEESIFVTLSQLLTCSQPISPVLGDGVLDDLLLAGTEEELQVGGTGSLRRTKEFNIIEKPAS